MNKSPKCILKTFTIIFEDDSELEFRVLSVVSFQGDDYLILEDLDAKDCIPVKYTETNTIDGFEIEQVDKDIEKIVLSIFDGVSR